MLHLLLLSQVVVSTAFHPLEDKRLCDISKVSISGGSYKLNEEDNTIVYSCPSGQYPYPWATRKCLHNNLWENQNVQTVCKDVQCPSPVIFENGEYMPRKNSYTVGDVLQFECWGGFQMKGPESRTCQENGKWSGRTTICDDHDGFCPNPGVPLGSRKAGTFYGVGDKVTYRCMPGLFMFGSRERTCTEDRYWTGSEPSCRAWYAYDTAEEVSDMLSTSLSANIEVADPNKNPDEFAKRNIKIKKGDPMNIIIVLDASKSVGEKNFKTSKDCVITFIEKISSFDITPHFAIVSYASKPITVVGLSDEESVEADEVIEKLKNFNYGAHADKGTNTRGALTAVYEMLVLQEVRRGKEAFMKIRNVILLMTDGQYNMGGDPRVEMTRIKNFLDIRIKDGKINRDEFLDVYVFGLGKDIDQNELNDLASKKNGETHTFHLQSIDTMKNAFDKMIDDTDAMDMCGLNKDIPEKDIDGNDFDEYQLKEKVKEKFPWMVKITRGASGGCKGSILSKNFILTAAHCFHLDEDPRKITVQVGDMRAEKIINLYRHPMYEPAGKKDKNITRSFDYDFAILQVAKKLEFSSKIRPICIPCTKSSSWALRQKGDEAQCKDHKEFLLKGELIKALFVAEEEPDKMEQMNVAIKTGNARESCLQAAKTIKELENVTDIRDMVTDQFLCTGGTEPYVEPSTCKGDSGGPLIIECKKRFIQVGVVSWGTVNHCEDSKRLTDPIPENARDFHVSLFDALSWIKEIVKEDLTYIFN